VSWPPQLQDLKDYLGLSDNRDDATLATSLDAAVEWVEGARAGDFNFAGDPDSLLPNPGQTLSQGTVRLASRWQNLRRSPDGLIDMGELGSARIPGSDIDIERMLRIGRFRAPMVG
jgi:hypothetical protein